MVLSHKKPFAASRFDRTLATSKMIHPALEPKVYEDGMHIAFSLTYKGKEKIFAELELPKELQKPEEAAAGDTPPGPDSNG